VCTSGTPSLVPAWRRLGARMTAVLHALPQNAHTRVSFFVRIVMLFPRPFCHVWRWCDAATLCFVQVSFV
jgi:hypothetical protein